MLFTPDTIFSPTAIGPLGNITILVTSTFRNEMNFSFVSQAKVTYCSISVNVLLLTG